MIDQKRFLSLLWLMLSALPFLTCKFTQTRPTPVLAGFDWQGHRGCRGLLPENSIPAFLKALEFNDVTTLELDVAVSKDGQLIVSHEPWFNSAICLGPGGDSLSAKEPVLLYRLTAAEIRAFDCGSLGNPRFPQQTRQAVYKPALSEVVAAVRAQYPARPVRWNIEIKSKPEWDSIRTPPVETFARMVVDALQNLDLETSCTVQSFDKRALQAVHRLRPALRLALLIEDLKGFDANLETLGFAPAIYSPYYLMVNKKLVRRCHARGIQIIPWTVNDVPAMRRLIRLGVDGIITDYPDKIALAVRGQN